MNILNMIREQISPDLLGQISKSVGESPDSTRSALEQTLPALLGGAAATASSSEGATTLFDSIKKATPQQGWPASVGSLLGGLGGQGGGAGGIGSSFVSSLLGSKMNMVRDFIAGQSGIRGGSATSLLGIGAQLLMGFLGKQVVSQGLGASGFGQLLRSQVPHLQGLLPPELSKMVGLGNLAGTTDHVPPPVTSYATPTETTNYVPAKPAVHSAAKTLRWAAIPLALLLFGVLLYRHYRSDMGGTRDETWTSISTGAAASAAIPPAATGTLSSFTDNIKAAIERGDAAPAELPGLTFDSSGTPSADAKTKLSALGKLINENPSLKVTVTAYGNTADEAATRANGIKSTLAGTGLSSERITTQTEIGEGWPRVSFTK